MSARVTIPNEVDRNAAPTRGVCRVCGCDAANACIAIYEADPEFSTCWWADQDQTICSFCAERGRPVAYLPKTPAAWLAAVATAQSTLDESVRGEMTPADEDLQFAIDILRRAHLLGIAGPSRDALNLNHSRGVEIDG